MPHTGKCGSLEYIALGKVNRARCDQSQKCEIGDTFTFRCRTHARDPPSWTELYQADLNSLQRYK